MNTGGMQMRDPPEEAILYHNFIKHVQEVSRKLDDPTIPESERFTRTMQYFFCPKKFIIMYKILICLCVKLQSLHVPIIPKTLKCLLGPYAPKAIDVLKRSCANEWTRSQGNGVKAVYYRGFFMKDEFYLYPRFFNLFHGSSILECFESMNAPLSVLTELWRRACHRHKFTSHERNVDGVTYFKDLEKQLKKLPRINLVALRNFSLKYEKTCRKMQDTCNKVTTNLLSKHVPTVIFTRRKRKQGIVQPKLVFLLLLVASEMASCGESINEEVLNEYFPEQAKTCGVTKKLLKIAKTMATSYFYRAQGFSSVGKKSMHLSRLPLFRRDHSAHNSFELIVFKNIRVWLRKATRHITKKYGSVPIFTSRIDYSAY